ncbi:MAG TPA: DUF4129 domain-containing protein [Terracidiphilus sp.]|nr:DUF4129 domain-containing protein [Terracidiphilus sp.]
MAQQPLHSPIPSAPAPTSGGWHDVSMADYLKHLETLSAMVEACAKARDAKACDPAMVGQDDRVSLSDEAHVERRPVRYNWLRVLLQQAQKKDAASAGKTVAGMKIPQVSGALPPPPTTTELLQSAEKRLAADEQQASGAMQPEPQNAAQREDMEQVLAGREFRGLSRNSPGESLKEKIDNWLNSLFAGAAGLGARAPWFGRAIVLAFILAVCAGLVWGLVQMERQWRIRLTPESMMPAPSAPSTRDWQLWLDDARKAATAGLWRDAIHCVYWAAISHLESRRLWPSDRARTPREYLALMAGEDPRRAGLVDLTGSFERTWYGGRPAGEGEFRRAEELANGLIISPMFPMRGAGR